MKRHLFSFFLVFALLAPIFAPLYAPLFAQIPADWDIRPPRDTDSTVYSAGVSQPSPTEQAALADAWRDAVRSLAYSIGTHFQGQTDLTVQSEGYASGVEDAYTLSVETASFSAGVRLTGVREAARKIERAGGGYVARVLASISREDYNKALAYLDNEMAAFRAYGFFVQKGLAPPAGAGKAGAAPAGFQDYSAWLHSACVIIAVEDARIAEQMDGFIKKVYRNAVVFADIIIVDAPSGSLACNARIVYGAAKYYDGLLRALQNTALFSIRREGATLVLAPRDGSGHAAALAGLKAAVASMKDSSKYIIVGSETIQTQSGVVAGNEIVISQFKSIAARQFGLQAASFSIPSQYTSGAIDEDGLVSYISRNAASVSARYLVICHAETQLEEGIPEYKLPPLIAASCRFALYDLVTGETRRSETITTPPGAFSPANLRDQAVVAASREALRFLSNPKNQLDLAEIMRELLQ
ncbi:MAG: hypothetical protein LBF60_02445 [Treponema sp.]|jgi:hypothetical protein|nr:hypothetical protein [Treponema sp.]